MASVINFRLLLNLPLKRMLETQLPEADFSLPTAKPDVGMHVELARKIFLLHWS